MTSKKLKGEDHVGGENMNELTLPGTMTVREVAEITGAAYSTVAAYAQKAGWTENGKQTLLNEKQVAIIVEAMKQAQHNQTRDTFQAGLEGIETTQSRAVRIAVLAQRQQEIDRQIKAELEAEIAELKTKTEADAPKAAFFDQVADSRDAIDMREHGRNLEYPRVRAEQALCAPIERVLHNYTVMGVLNTEQAGSIMGLINGLFPKAPIQREGKIIYFPGTVPKEQAPEPPPSKPKELSYYEIKELFDKQGIYVDPDMRLALLP